MPDIIIVAGPNGAGKTRFIDRLLPRQTNSFKSLNADTIEKELRTTGEIRQNLAIAAARSLLEQIDSGVAAGIDLMVETTLASRTYATRRPIWQRSGYRVSLYFLRLPSAEAALARVRRRVSERGHDIPEADVRRRFPLGLRYFDELYKPVVNCWELYDSIEGEFEFVAKSE